MRQEAAPTPRPFDLTGLTGTFMITAGTAGQVLTASPMGDPTWSAGAVRLDGVSTGIWIPPPPAVHGIAKPYEPPMRSSSWENVPVAFGLILSLVALFAAVSSLIDHLFNKPTPARQKAARDREMLLRFTGQIQPSAWPAQPPREYEDAP